MNKVVHNFFKNYYLDSNWNDDKSVNELSREFNNYVFTVYFSGYVKKTITFSAIQIRKKDKKINENEELSLNVVSSNFNEEKINLITNNDEEFEKINEFNIKDDNYNYNEISHNIELIKAIKILTDRQKEIVCKCIILGETDTLVAKELGISKQGVNKTKLLALDKLRQNLKKNA